MVMRSTRETESASSEFRAAAWFTDQQKTRAPDTGRSRSRRWGRTTSSRPCTLACRIHGARLHHAWTRLAEWRTAARQPQHEVIRGSGFAIHGHSSPLAVLSEHRWVPVVTLPPAGPDTDGLEVSPPRWKGTTPIGSAHASRGEIPAIDHSRNRQAHGSSSSSSSVSCCLRSCCRPRLWHRALFVHMVKILHQHLTGDPPGPRGRTGHGARSAHAQHRSAPRHLRHECRLVIRVPTSRSMPARSDIRRGSRDHLRQLLVRHETLSPSAARAAK